MRWFVDRLIVGSVVLLTLAGASQAQLSNKPYAFKNGQGSVGMSTAARQAIINQKILGVTPRVLLKSGDGRLLGLQRGPGNTAIVSTPSGELIPQYRGRGFQNNDRTLNAGVFNNFFTSGRSKSTLLPLALANSTTATVSRWTNTVQNNAPVSPGASSVEQWTAMTYFMGSRY